MESYNISVYKLSSLNSLDCVHLIQAGVQHALSGVNSWNPDWSHRMIWIVFYCFGILEVYNKPMAKLYSNKYYT